MRHLFHQLSCFMSCTKSTPELQQRYQNIESILLELQPFWRSQPFKQLPPAWAPQHPQLAEAIAALSDAELKRLRSDDIHLYHWLSEYLPIFSRLPALLDLNPQVADESQQWKHLDWAVPGRKWQQITAFSAGINDITRPLIEWCGGKGHLGRLLATKAGVRVMTLERDTALCEAGEELAQRARVKQIFTPVDVFSAATPNLHQHHVVALHACGGLHRHLLRKAVSENCLAIDIAPCCYHLYGEPIYRSFNSESRLHLSRDDLRIAITETVTSKPREIKLRDREMAWKLGFLHLYATLSGKHNYYAIAPIDKAWLTEDFEKFCWQLARREHLEYLLTDELDWIEYEQLGWQKQAAVMRFSLLRHAVRRLLELWLVLDMALYLKNNHYHIHLTRFCDSQLTPRNILLSARRTE